ncbi:MAG: 4Fe-4S binding protein [Desulfovibrionaceae bacterium]|nr:4Fe-4S binding protein [Desulfovibrionaceae bacterium]
MSSETKTIAEINSRLAAGEAVIMTAMELKARVRAGETFTPADVDVVTTATRAVMSGTSAMLSLPIGENGSRVSDVRLNDVPCLASFATEKGLTPAILNGTEESHDHHGRYGGGHVLRELVERKAVDVTWRQGGRQHYRTVTLDEMPFARLYPSRNSYQNYMGFTNIKNASAYRNNPTSIFACRPIPPLAGLAVSGSGEMNPGENDSGHSILRPGMRVLVNGAVGMLVGYGTRSSAEQVCFASAADMRTMDPQYMGGFRTSYGVEICNSLAVPFPITSQDVLDRLMACRDECIPHYIGDLSDRIKLVSVKYSQIWHDTPLEVAFDPERCISCSFQCEAEYYCPMNAISWQEKIIDQDLCVACGACTANCPGGAFMGQGWGPRRGLGDIVAFGKSIPIIFRQSNRLRAHRLAELLKSKLLERDFFLVDTDARCLLWNS